MLPAWTLPAGQVFVDEIRDRLERGDQLTMCLPAQFDTVAFADHLRRALPLFAHQVVDVRQVSAVDPLDTMLSELRVALEPGEVGSVDELLLSPSAAGVAVWLVGIEALPEDERRLWARLTRDVCRATRRLSGEGLPPRLAWLAIGRVDELEPSEPGWSKLLWWGRMSRLDTSLYLQSIAPEIGLTQRSCAVELAGFDLGLAERLAAERPSELPELAEILLDEAAVRGFVDEPDERGLVRCHRDGPGRLAGSWTRGEVDVYDGESHPFWHSCLYAEEKGLICLRRRLWRGQVNQLLPRLEEWRMQLIEVSKQEGFIAHGVRLDELEFKDLHNHLRAGHQGARRSELADFAGWLRGARNRLAHLQLLEPASHSRGEHLASSCLP